MVFFPKTFKKSWQQQLSFHQGMSKERSLIGHRLVIALELPTLL